MGVSMSYGNMSSSRGMLTLFAMFALAAVALSVDVDTVVPEADFLETTSSPTTPVGTDVPAGTPSELPPKEVVESLEHPGVAAEQMALAGNGCCRFTGWKAKNRGHQTKEGCMALCMSDSTCSAADVARPNGDKFACYTFTGDAKDLKPQCNTNSNTEECYKKEAAATAPVVEEPAAAAYVSGAPAVNPEETAPAVNPEETAPAVNPEETDAATPMDEVLKKDIPDDKLPENKDDCTGPFDSDDASIDPVTKVYNTGCSRRRVGAGFGRRRRTPVPKKEETKKKESITAPKPPVKEEEPVPVSVVHPNGEKEVTKTDPDAKDGIDCDKCIADFDAAGGCNVWKKGGDPTNLEPKGCAVCGKAAAEHCGITEATVSKHEAQTEIPKPIEHPKQAAALQNKAAEQAQKDTEKEALPKTVAETVTKDLEEAGAEPVTPAPAPVVKEEVKQTEQQKTTTAAKDDAKAAVDGSAASAAAGTAAKAEKEAVAAEADVEQKKAAAASPTVVKTAEAKAAAAEKTAANDDATSVKEQATADKTAATAEKADDAATPGETEAETETEKKTETPTEEELPKTEAEVNDNKAEDWAETTLKKEEAAAGTKTVA